MTGTIAIAWSFAVLDFTTGKAHAIGTQRAPGYAVRFTRHDSAGLTLIGWHAEAAHDGQPDEWRAFTGGVDAAGKPTAVEIPHTAGGLPRWSGGHRLPDPLPQRSSAATNVAVFEVASGWPARTMVATFEDLPPGAKPAGPPYRTLGGIERPVRRVRLRGAIVFEPRALPVRPIWPEFFGSAAAIGCATALVLWGVPASRRGLRRRRGLCPGCGYDMRGLASGMCPECGRGRRVARAPDRA